MNSSKILTCKSDLITDHLFSSEGEKKTLIKRNFDSILAFFNTKEEVDIVLAGFVSDVVEDLLCNEYDIVSNYLFGNLSVIDQFIRHSYDYSVCRKILQSLLFQKDTGLNYDMDEQKKEKQFDRRILIAFDRLFLKLNTSKDNEVCSNILSLIKEAVDLEEEDKEKIDYIKTTLYSESSLNALFSFLTNNSSFSKGKQNFNLCLQTLNKLITFYPKLAKEEEKKDEQEEQQKPWLTQNFIDKIEFFKDILENQKQERFLNTNGEEKQLLSSSRIHIIKLIISALKLNNQPINVTLSLSNIFQTITVG